MFLPSHRTIWKEIWIFQVILQICLPLNLPKVKMLLQTIFQQFLEVHLIQPFSRSYNENDKVKKIQTLSLTVEKNEDKSRLWQFIIQRKGKDKLLTLSRMSNKNSYTIIFLAVQGSSIGDLVSQSLSKSLLNSVSSEHCRAVVDTSVLTRRRRRRRRRQRRRRWERFRDFVTYSDTID